MTTRREPPTLIEEYGCCACQTWHRRGIDPEYEPHLMFMGKHGFRRVMATAAEVLMIEMGGRPSAKFAGE